MRLNDGLIRNVAAAITAAIERDDAIPHHLRTLLVRSSRAQSALDILQALPAIFQRLTDLCGEVVEAVLPEILEERPEQSFRIRRFFLQPATGYSIEELTMLWQITSDEAHDIFHDELNAWTDAHPDDPEGFRIRWSDALEKSVSFGFLRPHDVEVALGTDFSRVRSERFRTIPVLIRLPIFISEAVGEDPALASPRRLASKVEHLLIQLFGRNSSR